MRKRPMRARSTDREDEDRRASEGPYGDSSAATDPKGGSYGITTAARLSGYHPQTLRFYERRGLIRPQRTSGNVRRYTDEDIQRLLRIKDLAKRGASLEAVKKILDLEAERARLLETIAFLRRQIEARGDPRTGSVWGLHDAVQAAEESYRPASKGRRTGTPEIRPPGTAARPPTTPQAG